MVKKVSDRVCSILHTFAGFTSEPNPGTSGQVIAALSGDLIHAAYSFSPTLVSESFGQLGYSS
jgi:hypothetical protein